MTDIPLREYFQILIVELEKRRDAIREADQNALRLQAQEYERRLDNLNGEHVRIDRIVTQKVDRKEWEDYQKRQLLTEGELIGKTKLTALIYSGLTLLLTLAGVIVAFEIHK